MKLAAAHILDLHLIDYIKAFELQKRIVADRINEEIDHDTILILEHPPVFTLGKRGGRENIVVSEEFLKLRDIAIIQTESGGNITYHGPGQIVLYPLVNLDQRKIGVSDFVYDLEEVMIKTAADFGVAALRDARNHGVWVGNRAKLGSIGLSVKRGISFHGLAFNVNLDLTPFKWINPCGMSGVSMTSIENEIQNSAQLIDIGKVKETLLFHFQNITGIEL